MMLVKLNRPIRRRIGDRLVVTVKKKGVELRGYRCRRPLFATWAQIAAAAAEKTPIGIASDKRIGQAAMEEIRAADANEGPPA